MCKCIVAGQLHQLWTLAGDGQAIQLMTNKQRELSSTTVVKNATMVAGTPFDLQVPIGSSLETLHLVNQLTAVEPAWLNELAPETFVVRPGKMFYDPKYGTLAARTQLHFNGQVLDTASTPQLEHSSENQRQFVTQYSLWLAEQLEKERRDLQAVNFRKIPAVPLKQIEQQVRFSASGAVTIQELPKAQRLALVKLAKLETYLGSRFMAGLTRQEDAKHKHRHGFKRSWKPNHQKKHQARNNNRHYDPVD